MHLNICSRRKKQAKFLGQKSISKIKVKISQINHVLFFPNPYKPSILFVGQANSADPDLMPQNVASDQGFHCLLKECSIKI